MTTLVAIGGNENHKKPIVLQEFLDQAGGENGNIVIFPQPSVLLGTGKEYENLFLELGARTARSLEFRTRPESYDHEYLTALHSASGIFISGGSQMRLPAIIGGTPIEAELIKAYQQGVVIGGTSAGAALMSKVMIARGKKGPTPREGLAQYSAGIGFTDKIVFDQHFRQQDRLGRLLYLIAAHPGLLGVGVDENTAAIVKDESLITVVGSGGVTIIDGSEMENTNIAEVEGGGAIAVSNVHIHILTAGCSFDVDSRKAAIPGLKLLNE